MRLHRVARWMIASVLLVVAAYISITELTEAYGSGPPFYDRTTNMDKWASPWPLVIIVDVVAILLIGMVLRPRRAMRDRRPGDR